jgi:Trk K+ transport system NAD-binding subunit
MTKRIAIAGYGAVGRTLAERFSLRGDEVRIVQRLAPELLRTHPIVAALRARA